MSRVLWLNSLPQRLKKEILNKLLDDKIELSAKDQYRIKIDLGYFATVHTNSPSKQINEHNHSSPGDT